MSYPGSKGQAGTFERIIGQMPPHEMYVEAFAGSGQIFKRKKRAAVNVLIDRNPMAIARFSAEAGVRAIVGDAISELGRLDLQPDALVYCDPPYPLSTRQGRFYYDHEMTDDDHRQLLALLQALCCDVMISSYPNEIYSGALLTPGVARMRAWRCINYRARTRGRTVTESLWCNFPEPHQLHDWRYAGQNFRQRLSLKRLAARWLARLEEMPPRKRGYVLNAIEQHQRNGK